MEDIKEFLIEKVKEKHIIDNILNFYYEDWEEVQFKELKRRKGKKALATLCIGGGQGAAFLLEV